MTTFSIELVSLSTIKSSSITLAFSCADKTQKGEAVITNFGIEGSGVYPLSENIRKQLTAHQKAIIHVDFKLELTEKELVDILTLMVLKQMLLQLDQKNLYFPLNNHLHIGNALLSFDIRKF